MYVRTAWFGKELRISVRAAWRRVLSIGVADVQEVARASVAHEFKHSYKTVPDVSQWMVRTLVNMCLEHNVLQTPRYDDDYQSFRLQHVKAFSG